MKKVIKIDFRGEEVHEKMFKGVLAFNGLTADNQTIRNLDDEINFIVCDLKEAHGNLNKPDKSAWLCPKNGDNSFNISINW